MRQILKAKSSSGGTYDVTVSDDGGLFSMNCTCTAGMMKQLCKYRQMLIDGSTELLDEPFDLAAFEAVRRTIKESRYAAVWGETAALLADVEARRKELKKEEKQIRAMFGRRLSDGL